MNGTIPDRVQKLMDEVAEIRERNTEYLERSHHIAADNIAHEKREQRLVEILNELTVLSKRTY